LGSGIADVRGFNLRSDSDLIQLISHHDYGIEESYITKFHNGTSIYRDPGGIVEGAPLETYFDLIKTVKSCEDAQNELKKVSNLKELGIMYLQPVIANTTAELTGQIFHLVLGSQISVYSCAEWEKRINEINSRFKK
jgi:hypothetical protein